MTGPTMDDLRRASLQRVIEHIPMLASTAALAADIEDADIELRRVSPPTRLDHYREIAAERARTTTESVPEALRHVARAVADGRLA